LSNLVAASPPPATVQAPAAASTAGTKAGAAYDAFVSYSHAQDKPIAAALQSAMQRLGKAWYQRRALRLFRDDTSLSATPHLWPSIEEALAKARFLILIASPEAASSPWVDKELAWWLGHNGPNTVLIALTAGELAWDGEAGDFRWLDAMPLPPALKGAFPDEPLWIDLREYRDRASPRDARFADLAASIAAALHGRPKEDLLSQEVRQQRRALRLAGSAVGMLLVLLALAGWQWTVARAQRNRAEHSLALATQTANGLVFNLAQKFRNSGVPAAVIGDILARARQLQDQLTAGGEISPELRSSHADALIETVDTLLTVGDVKGGLTAAQQAHDIFAALLAGAPDSTYYKHELGVSDDRLGDALQVQGDSAGALAAYRDYLAIAAALAQGEPGNTRWQHDLWVSKDKIAAVLVAQGDSAGALAAYRDGLAIGQALAQKEPDNTDWQRDLSVGDDKVGDVLRAQGDLTGALAAYRDGLANRQALAQKDPDNTQWQRDLSVSDNKIGDVLIVQGDLTGALAAYRNALSIAKTLAQADPSNTQWQRDLSFSDNRIGDVLWAQGDLAGAVATYRDSLATRKALAQKDPGNILWQRDLSFSDNKIGDVLRAQGDLAGALAAYRDGLSIAKALAQTDPSNVHWQIDLAFSFGRLAGRGDDPRANLTAALAILKRLDAAGTLPPDIKGWIADDEAKLAKTTP
jgi:tetratricopeptide (TPR) repeat protein